MKQIKKEEQVIFTIGADHDGVPMVVLAVPEKAWEYMKDGKTHNFDLTKAGLNLRIMVFGGKDHESIISTIKQAQGYAEAIKAFDKDFSIKGPSEH